MHLNEERWNIEKRFREYAWTEFYILKRKGMLFQDNIAAMDTLRANLHTNIFLAGHLDNYSKMMYPEIREAWSQQIDMLVDRMYQIAQPKVRRIELIKNDTTSKKFKMDNDHGVIACVGGNCLFRSDPDYRGGSFL